MPSTIKAANSGPSAHQTSYGRLRGAVRVAGTSAELISDGVRPELLMSLALRRTSGGGVAKFGSHYFDHGRLVPSYLTGVFDELADTGLLRLAEQDPWGLRRVSPHRGDQ